MYDGPSVIFYIMVILLITLVLRNAKVIGNLSYDAAGLIHQSSYALEGR